MSVEACVVVEGVSWTGLELENPFSSRRDDRIGRYCPFGASRKNACPSQRFNSDAPDGRTEEGVEIYLYYETHLRERLGLFTAIQTMAYGALGRRDSVAFFRKALF